MTRQFKTLNVDQETYTKIFAIIARRGLVTVKNAVRVLADEELARLNHRVMSEANRRRAAAIRR